MAEISTETPENSPIILEQNQRLSDSLLWQLQRNYFEQQSIQAWSQGTVPHYITSNPFIANAYAKVVFGFFRDCYGETDFSENFSKIDRTQPIYIIELGSGCGRLAYHFLKRFQDIHTNSICRNIPFQYIMTDFTERNLDYWQSHPWLQPLISQGILDFACFDLECDREIKLSQSGNILSVDTLKNPVIILANYVFDSIPQDIFYLENGKLYERLVTLSTSQPVANFDNPELLKHLETIYHNRLVTNRYYEDSDFNCILEDYQKQLTHTTLVFPVAALEGIRNLCHLSGGRMLLLSGDKGYSHPSTLQNRGDPKITRHGSFSMMVNYHAIAQYIQNQGGQFLDTSHQHTSLDICAFLLGNFSKDYRETRLAYREAIEKSSPDDFFSLKKGIEKNYQNLSLEQILAYLRLSFWDANIFWGCFPTLMQQVESASESIKGQVYLAIEQIWDNYYPIGEKRDIAFALGTVLAQIEYYPQALPYFNYSLQLYGADADTLYNIGICHYQLEEFEEALDKITLSLALKPDFAAAKRMERQIQKILDPMADTVLPEEVSAEFTQAEMKVESPVNEITFLLQRLDIRLEYALAAAEIAYGKSAATDSYRGLHVNSEDIHRSLSHPPGVPLFHPNAEINLPSDFIPADSRLAQLQQQFELSEFDVDIIAIALAPELDLRYHRIYAYLQDDIRCKLPSVDLALNLLCPHAADKLAKRIHFAPDAPLIRHNLLHLVSDSTSAKSTLLAREFYLDNQIVRFLLAQPGIDERLAPYCQLIYPTISPINLSLTPELKQGFKTLLSQNNHQKNKFISFYFQGTDIPGKLETAVSLAGEIQVPLITVNLSLIIENKHNFRSTLQLILREAWFQKAVLYLDGLDSLYGEEQVIYYQYLIEAIAPEFGKKLDYTLAPSLFKGGWGGENCGDKQVSLPKQDNPSLFKGGWGGENYGDKQISLPKQDNPPLFKGGWGGENCGDKQISLPKQDNPHKPTIIILSGIQPWIPSATRVMGIIAISFPHPNFAQRRESWQTHLTEANIALDNTNLDILTDRFRLTSHQIANAVKNGENAVSWQISTGLTNELTKTTIDALFAAARAQSGHHLASLTQKIEPTYSWDDIILSPDAKTQLREICDRAKYRHLVQEEWGFDDKLSLGKGINVLFSGQPGTGKTMAAEVIANELQLDLYKIDLSQIVSKYIGETEKNLNRIFTAATNANAILLFDEADALFGKRSEVKDAHDRYANIETGYLLQKMEEYDGIAILTTNFRNNIDDAFERRLAVIIEFPFPNQKQRRQIWQQILPDSIPCSSDLDLDFLARHFEITGANIRNIALAAAYLAAADGRQLQMIHLIRALRREYQKMGKILREEEFGKYAGVR